MFVTATLYLLSQFVLCDGTAASENEEYAEIIGKCSFIYSHKATVQRNKMSWFNRPYLMQFLIVVCISKMNG